MELVAKLGGGDTGIGANPDQARREKPRAVERLLGPEPVIRTRRRRCYSIRCSCLRAAPRLRRSQGARRAGRPPARAVSTIFRQQGGVSDRGAYAAGHITDLSAAYVVLKDFLSNATEERGRKQWELQSGGVEPRTPRGERTWMIYEAESGTVVAKKLDEIEAQAVCDQLNAQHATELRLIGCHSASVRRFL